MKISAETLSILKNFSNINSNIVVKPGSTLKTLSPAKNILAESKISEVFDKEIGIWDLNKFLGTISLFKDPEFSFEESYVKISSESSRASINYYYSDPSILASAPANFKMPAATVEFQLIAKDYAELQKAAAVLQVPDLALEGQPDGLYLKVFDKKDSTTNHYQIRVGDNPNNLKFTALFKTENLKIYTGNYTVRVSNKGISEFENTTTGVKYWISLESDSNWN